MAIQTKKRDTKVRGKRLKWPKRHNDDGTETEEYSAYVRDMGVCYDLVATARGVLRRPDLRLKAGGPQDGITRAATDGTTIFLPKMHPNRRLVIKHELSHIYFKSNIPLRLLFVKQLIADFERQSKKTFAQSTKEKLLEDLCFFINILDDVRVNSLWGVLYPGAGRDMDEWYYGEIGPEMMEKAEAEFPNGDIDNLFTFAILICLNQDPKSTKWAEFKDDILRARDDVHFKSFNACLVITKKLLVGIIRRVAEKEQEEQQEAQQPQAGGAGAGSSGQGADGLPWGGNPQPLDEWDEEAEKADKSTGPGDIAADGGDIDQLVKQRLLAKQEEEKQDPAIDFVQALTKIEDAQRPGKDFADDNAGFDFDKQPESNSPLLNGIARSLNQVDVEDEDQVWTFLDQQDEQGLAEANELRAKIDQVNSQQIHQPLSKGQHLRKGVKADLNLVFVKRADIVPVVLTPEECRVAEHWRRFFQRVMGVLAMRTDEAGYELLPELYIQQKLANHPLTCFRRDTTGRGFRLKIVVDMSGSMGSCFREVEKLVAVLQAALNFPFVHLDVVGFNSLESGAVSIYMYPKRTPGLISPRSQVDGVTPLSQAIQVAGRDLVGLRDDSHLFVLSDGMPYYFLKTAGQHGRSHRSVDTNTLVNWTSAAVAELQRARVKTWCFMIGHSRSDAQKMDRMFGHGFWKGISLDDVYRESFQFIVERFMQYLRSR